VLDTQRHVNRNLKQEQRGNMTGSATLELEAWLQDIDLSIPQVLSRVSTLSVSAQRTRKVVGEHPSAEDSQL